MWFRVITLIFSEYFSETIGFDVSEKNALRAKELFKKGKSIQAHFIIGDACTLPFKEQIFDVVSAFSLIEHLVRKEKFVSEVSRILKKRGVFIMQFPNAAFPIDLHTGIFLPQIIPRVLVEVYCKKILKWDSYHIKNLTNKETLRISKPFFGTFMQIKMNYSEDVIPTKFFRLLYNIFKKFRFLEICPLGYLIICTNPIVSTLPSSSP